MKVVEGPYHPVFVGGGIELRIGDAKRGQSRLVFLTATQAKLVAYALLSEAAKAERPAAERKRGATTQPL